MNSDKEMVSQLDLLTIIEDFIGKSSGLSLTDKTNSDVSVWQKGDSKKIKIKKMELSDVLLRKDGEGKEFVQINLSTGRRILLTDQLVGFKPIPVAELDVAKLPRVVTTLDLLSVFEAIEESFTATNSTSPNDDSETLRRVFNAILLGGEDVGFDLSTERSWLKRLSIVPARASS